jgi:hypothetical protein
MMVVVDTNVPVVANGHSKQASPECTLNCVEWLRKITSGVEKLVLDGQWRIIREYMSNLRSSGQPGVGDAFLRWVLINWNNTRRCELVTITPTDVGETSFQEFPAGSELSDFDPDDRKFVAVALAHGQKPPILQAVDTAWWELRDALCCNGVKVEFLCENDIRRLAEGI